MVSQLILWLGWAVPSAILLALELPRWSLLPPAAFALAAAWWREAPPSAPAVVGVAVAALSLLVWHGRLARSRRRACAIERVQAAEAAWWRAMRAHTSSRAGFCARLRAYALAAWESGEAVAALERAGAEAKLNAPPQPPELRPDAGRPGPLWLWEQFDTCHRAASQRASLNPSADCLVLAQVALELVKRIECEEPALPAGHHSDGITEEEFSGPQAALVHVLCAPSLAGLTAAHLVGEQSARTHVDFGALAEEIDRSGTEAQTTLIALGLLLGECPDEDVSVGELLDLEDTDLAHALEATALKRGLRRVYPSQRPDSLWVRAALTQAGDDPGRR
jgi:hypothetical protein